jgi:hypothetical protein
MSTTLPTAGGEDQPTGSCDSGGENDATRDRWRGRGGFIVGHANPPSASTQPLLFLTTDFAPMWFNDTHAARVRPGCRRRFYAPNSPVPLFGRWRTGCPTVALRTFAKRGLPMTSTSRAGAAISAVADGFGRRRLGSGGILLCGAASAVGAAAGPHHGSPVVVTQRGRDLAVPAFQFPRAHP